MRATILFVCSANICRSPSALAVFRRHLHDAGRDSTVTVKSAGVHARVGDPWCDTARHAVGKGTREQVDEDAIRSTPLRAAMLERATMVVTADAATSAQVLRTMPQTRSRLFTMREAATLGELVVTRADDVDSNPSLLAGLVVARPGSGPNLGLSWLISEMNAARGQLRKAVPPRRRWWQRAAAESPSERDIPDAHGTGKHASHRRTMPMLIETIDSFAASVVHVSSPDVAGSDAAANAG